MKLALKQYLSSLKESKELDSIFPDLLSAMNIVPISKPQVGVRQNGVDLAAIGKDLDTNKKTLFLFVIKCDNIRRNNWDSGPQSIRQTLNEIKDVYILNNILKRHKQLPIKIILVTGGDLLQEVYQNWIGYCQANACESIDYDYWGGDKLALLFHEYLFNENILLPEFRSLFRKSLVMVSDSSYQLEDYYNLFNKLLGSITKRKSRKNTNLMLTCKLCLKILIEWAKEANNYKHAIKAAEYSVLLFWNKLRNSSLLNNKEAKFTFIALYNLLLNLLIENSNKFSNLYSEENGLHGYSYSQSPEIESLIVFEQLGLLAEAGILSYFHCLRFKSINNSDAEIFEKNYINISNNLIQLINNHKTLLNPLFDSHCIEISISILVLCFTDHKDFIIEWIYELVGHIIFAYNRFGKYFPVCSDNFVDAINVNQQNKEEMMCMSTLMYFILEWACILQDENLYDYIRKNLVKYFLKTKVQQWYPDESSEDKIYIENAGFGTGYTQVCSPIPKTMHDMIKMLNTARDKELSLANFSCVKNGFLDLLFISSRHFRTPVVPELLNMFVPEKDN